MAKQRLKEGLRKAIMVKRLAEKASKK